MFLGKFWIATFMVPCCLAVHNLRHSELEEMGAACYPLRDTCTVATSKNFLLRNCECDSQCQVYDDCCIDADLKMGVDRADKFTCVQDGMDNRGAYAVRKCQTGWTGPAQVRQRCESINDLSDPLIATPVTNPENGVTYKNRYCAECNGADPAHLKSWIIMVSCQSLVLLNSTGKITKSYIQDRLVYKSTPPYRNKWGLYHWDEVSERDKFYPCELRFQLPTYLRELVRLCHPNVISSCPDNWEEKSIREKCEAYMSVRYSDENEKTYRNPHCAICNNVDLSMLLCAARGVNTRVKTAMSFTLLLDINLNDGDRVGEINRCSQEKQYDSFFKKCRKLVCALKGYVRKGDKCVPEEK